MATEGKSSEVVKPSFRVEGLCSAPFTSFHEDGSLDLDGGVKSIVQQLIKSGVHYAFVGGTTGESLKMTVGERKKLLERWVAVVAELGVDMKIIAHVGAESLQDAIDLAKHAASIAVPAIAIMPSVFFKPPSIAALVDWVAAVADTVPSTAVYYYHLKVMTGVNFKVYKLLEACKGRVPNLVGVKFSDPDVWELSCCMRMGDYSMLYGKDEQLLAAMAMGCTGAVGSTYNYMGAEYNRMIAAFKRGDMDAARKHQAHAGDLVKLLHNGTRYGSGVNVQKAIMELIDVRVGPPRAPHKRPTDEGLALLRQDLTDIGFFDWRN